MLPLRQFEPCLLQLKIGEERALSPFFMWNFGYTTANFFAIQNHSVKGCQPASLNDHDLLETLAKRQDLAWSITICGDAPLARTAGDSWQRHFPVFYGTSPFNRVAYWNDGLTTGSSSLWGAGLRQLWLSPDVVKDEKAYKALIRLIQLRVHSNQQPRLRMLSCDANVGELESVGSQIVKDVRGALCHGDCVTFQGTAPAIPVEPRRIAKFPVTRTEIEYARGSDIHLAPARPLDVEENSDQSWMVDVHIYNPAQELWYSNAEPWWCLPRKASLAGIFTNRPSRILFDHRVSFEVSARDATLDFEIPSSEKVFRYLLLPQVHLHRAGDLRTEHRESRLEAIRLSDKGKYLSGILDLFSTLRGALYLFEHPFWRSVVGRFSERRPSQHLVDKLASDVRHFLASEPLEPKAAEAWLTDELVLASKQISRLPLWLKLKTLQALHADYISSLQPQERQLATTEVVSDLSELTRDGVAFQGSALRCPNCMSSYWYSIEEMHRSIACRGCHISFPLPAETPWSYQLNELIKAGVGDHGLSPVLRTLARLFDRASDSFFFTPSVEFLKYTSDGPPRPERELDLAWIKDGVFGIAEIKTTSKLFKPSDYEDLVALARLVKPDIVLIATPEGSRNDLMNGKKIVEEKLGNEVEVWVWGFEEFEHSPSWMFP